MAEAGFDFQDRSVLVTGGARGIGRAIAEGFAGLGGRVCVADIDEAVLAECGASFEARGWLVMARGPVT